MTRNRSPLFTLGEVLTIHTKDGRHLLGEVLCFTFKGLLDVQNRRDGADATGIVLRTPRGDWAVNHVEIYLVEEFDNPIRFSAEPLALEKTA